MIVFRLCHSKYSKDLSGTGAEKYSGRWNSRGTAMVYTCISRALCALEITVHTPLGNIPQNLSLISIEIPDNTKILELKNSQLNQDWKSLPHSNSTQTIGDQFIYENKFLIMKVPSAVIQGEFNYLINPHHKDMNTIKIIEIEQFNFDERLFIR